MALEADILDASDTWLMLGDLVRNICQDVAARRTEIVHLGEIEDRELALVLGRRGVSRDGRSFRVSEVTEAPAAATNPNLSYEKPSRFVDSDAAVAGPVARIAGVRGIAEVVTRAEIGTPIIERISVDVVHEETRSRLNEQAMELHALPADFAADVPQMRDFPARPKGPPIRADERYIRLIHDGDHAFLQMHEGGSVANDVDAGRNRRAPMPRRDIPLPARERARDALDVILDSRLPYPHSRSDLCAGVPSPAKREHLIAGGSYVVADPRHD